MPGAGMLCVSVNTIAKYNRYADALLAILGQPWKVMSPSPRLWCPGCLGRIEDGEHRDGCAWLIAARACGISD